MFTKELAERLIVTIEQGLDNLLSDYKRSKGFEDDHGIFGSQWMNVAPCKNLYLSRTDQQLRSRETKLRRDYFTQIQITAIQT